MASLDKLEEYFHTVEEYVYSSVSAVTHGLPDVHDVANKLWIDISRYGPGMPAFPEVHMPSLGDFQVPPPPPPPPKELPPSLVRSLADWSHNNPKKASSIVVGVLGAGLLIGYRVAVRGKPSRRVVSQRSASAQSGERRQVIVVLGGDSPYGLALILELERKGYIVIASVSNPDAVDTLEGKTKGYVKALVLNPCEPATVPVFLRSLSSTLSRRFPIKASGDPYSTPASQPYIQSVVSLLTLPASSPTPPTLSPVEHISLGQDYIPYLNATQISPLQVIQQLLPLLRTGSARSIDKGGKSIVICLPAVDAHVALPFSAVQAMSAAGTLKAVEILRREIAMAAATGKTESMKNIRVVTVDVGSIDITKAGLNGTGIDAAPNVLKATEGWTSSEKLIYGPAFVSQHHGVEKVSPWEGFWALFSEKRHYAVGRRPAKMSAFVNRIVGIVSEGRYGMTVFGHNLGLGLIVNWVRGDRTSVGAGANTYKLASYLPSLLLDGLLNLPYFLVGLRNKLVFVQPHRIPPRNLPSSRTSRTASKTSPSSSNSRQDFGQRSIAAVPEVRPETPASAGTEEITKEHEEVKQEEVQVKTPSDADSGPPSPHASVESSWVNVDGRV